MTRPLADRLRLVADRSGLSGGLWLAGLSEREVPAASRGSWPWVMGLSLAWSLIQLGLWHAAWAVFGYYNDVPLMSVALVLSVAVLGPYRRAVPAIGRLAASDGDRAGQAPVIAALSVILLALMLLGLKGFQPDWPHHLPPQWQWLRPRPMFRALLLGPLWGGWAMLIVPQFRRPGPRSEPAVAAFVAGCGPLVATGVLVALAAATTVYFNYLSWWQLTIPATTILAATAGGTWLMRRSGLCRDGLLAANWLTQIAFYAAYLANRW